MHDRRLARMPGAVEGGVEEVAAAVAGKDAAGAGGAVGGGGETDDPQPRARVAEPGNRLAPIIPLDERTAFLARDGAAVVAQPSTASTPDDLLVKLGKLNYARRMQS